MDKEVEFRKFQENNMNLINQGFHGELAKFYKAMFDAFVTSGFNRDEALQLVIAFIKKQ